MNDQIRLEQSVVLTLFIFYAKVLKMTEYYWQRLTCFPCSSHIICTYHHSALFHEFKAAMHIATRNTLLCVVFFYSGRRSYDMHCLQSVLIIL